MSDVSDFEVHDDLEIEEDEAPPVEEVAAPAKPATRQSVTKPAAKTMQAKTTGRPSVINASKPSNNARLSINKSAKSVPKTQAVVAEYDAPAIATGYV